MAGQLEDIQISVSRNLRVQINTVGYFLEQTQSLEEGNVTHGARER